MEKRETEIRKPGTFGRAVAADRLRDPFDEYNEQIVRLEAWPDLVILGDSIMERWDAALYLAPYGLRVENRGIGGDTTEYMAKRLEADVLQLRPRAAVLCGGINDMMGAQDDLWWQKPGRDEKTVTEEICRNLEDMALRCEAAGILPILATVHRCDLCQPWDNGKSDRILTAENDFLRELTARHGWPLLDWAACFERDGEKRIREDAVDGVHPDWNGYVLMRDALVACLRACGILKE